MDRGEADERQAREHHDADAGAEVAAVDRDHELVEQHARPARMRAARRRRVRLVDVGA